MDEGVTTKDETPELQRHDSSAPPEAKANPLKRKLSPSATKSPAPIATSTDDPIVAPLPPLVPASASTTEFFTTRSYPVNARGYRYLPCGPSTSTAIQRVIESVPQHVRFSWEDRSPFAYLTKDARTVTADKGWRAARANVCLREGNWYWEVNIVRAGGEGKSNLHDGSWVRTGVSRRESALNAPVGFDGYSYAYRDRKGDAVTLSRAKPYGRPYGSGDVVGIYLSLPPRAPPRPDDRSDPARIVRKRIPIRYRGQLFFESLEYAPSDEMEQLRADPADQVKENVVVEKAAPGQKVKDAADAGPPARPLPRLPGARLAFFLNGECQGVAFDDLFDFVPLRRHADKKWRKKNSDVHVAAMENGHDDGTMGYYPAVSCFGGGIATLNPGPDFAHPPPDDIASMLLSTATAAAPDADDSYAFRREAWRPLSERYVEQVAEQRFLDSVDDRLAAASASASAAAAAAAQTSGAQTVPQQPLANQHGRSHLLNDHSRMSSPLATSTLLANANTHEHEAEEEEVEEDEKKPIATTTAITALSSSAGVDGGGGGGGGQGRTLLFGGGDASSLLAARQFASGANSPMSTTVLPKPTLENVTTVTNVVTMDVDRDESTGVVAVKKESE